LLDPVDDSLARSKVDRTFPRNRLGDGSSLGGVLSLTFDGNGGAAENVELTLGSSKFVHFTHLGGGGDRVKDACFGDARFGVKGYKLIPVRSDSNSGILWFGGYHGLNVV